MKTLSERLKYVFESQKLKQNYFAKKMNRSNGTINGYVVGRTFPDEDFFVELKKELPTLNLNWLMANVGDPFENSTDAIKDEDIQEEVAKIEELQEQTMNYYMLLMSKKKQMSISHRSKTEPVCNNGSLRRVRFFKPVQDHMKVYRLVSQ